MGVGYGRQAAALHCIPEEAKSLITKDTKDTKDTYESSAKNN